MTDAAHPPTEEQEAILSAASGSSENLIVNALAGTGKTATLEMIEQAVKTRPILYLCFNKKNADEAKKRMSNTTSVRTFNSMGHRIWAESQNLNLTLEFRKTQDILADIIKELPDRAQGPVWEVFWETVNGVGLAKAIGYVPRGMYPNAKRLATDEELYAILEEEPSEIVMELIDTVLHKSIQAAYAGSIDFNDQVYMPAIFGGVFPKFPLVKVDEVQDLNPVNHALLARLAKRRLIAVGDDFQSIYQFRGAMPGGMGTIKERYSCEGLALTVSFRCPSAIVENARWRAPNFKAFKEGGSVEILDDLAPEEIEDGATFLCRNNAPLFAIAMHLLSAGRSVSVAGSDIGPRLIAQMKKLGPDSLPRVSLLLAIDEWLAKKEAKGSKIAADIAACMRVFANHGTTLSSAIGYAEHLFKQDGKIQLMTGHKAKGMEFPVVYHLDPWLCKEHEQDQNLRYVIQTRSCDRYYEIDSRSIDWNGSEV